MRLIDLSHPIVPFADNPYAQFPAGPKSMMGITNLFEDVGWFSRAWYLSEHCGTHVDAPVHFNPTFIRLPLPLVGGSGSPIRAAALVSD